MFIIDYNKNKYILTIDLSLDNDEFDQIYQFLLQRYIFYKNGWEIPSKRIDEMLLWFSKYDYSYILTSDAQKVFDEYKNSFKEETKFFRGIKFNKSILTENVRKFDYQIEGIEWLIKRNRCYLADDKGLGKTFQAIYWFSNFYKLGMIDFIFIIVKPRRALSWKYEILDFVNVFKDEDIGIVTNETKIKAFDIFKDKKIIITPNHYLGDIFASYKKGYNKKKKLSNLHWNSPFVDLKKVLNKENLCFIYDEAHEANHSTAVRTKSLYAHREFFDFRFLASATPAIENFERWWMSMQLLDSSIIPMSENAFKIEISSEIGNKFGIYNINKYDPEKIDYWRKQFSNWSIRRLKKDLKEKSTKLFIDPIYLELDGLQREIYQAIIQYEVFRLTEEYDNITYKLIIQKFPYLLQCIDSPILLRDKLYNDEINKLLVKWTIDKDARIQYLDEVIKKEVEKNGEKLIIYDNHPKVLNILAERYSKYYPIIIHGGMKDNEETSRKKEVLFNDKKSKNRICLINPVVVAGWNLQGACNKSIFNTMPNYALPFDQACDRTDRIISERDSFVEVLLLTQSLDIIRYKRVFNRVELNNGILDDRLSEEKLKELVNGII